MTVSDENVKRALQQMHDAAIDGLSQPYAFGLAMSFLTTIFVLTKQLSDENRLPQAAEDAQKNAVSGLAWKSKSLSKVGDKDGGDQATADYRHLRNCFSHGNWSYNEADVSSASMVVTLFDYTPGKNPTKTFEAEVELPDLVNLAERLLVETFNNM